MATNGARSDTLISWWMVSTIAMSEERRRSFVPISTRCRNSRWRCPLFGGIRQDGGRRPEHGDSLGNQSVPRIAFRVLPQRFLDAKEYSARTGSACTKSVRGDHPGSAQHSEGLHGHEDILPLQHGKPPLVWGQKKLGNVPDLRSNEPAISRRPGRQATVTVTRQTLFRAVSSR